MKLSLSKKGAVALGVTAMAAGLAGVEAVDNVASTKPPFLWSTVVNNNDLMPPLNVRSFNSYNQPSVNARGLVVLRARSRGGPPLGSPTHGIYTRDMRVGGSPIIRILDRTVAIPEPNNLGTTFVETPSFPRIDIWSSTIATRGNHQPVWNYVVGADPVSGEEIETRAGTTGIYTNPFGELITGASKLGAVPGFESFAVPGLSPPTMFDVFPGAPSVTRGSTIVFKGNYTVDGVGRTGVFYRKLEHEPIMAADGTELAPAGGDSAVVLIANNMESVIPGTNPPVIFGSTSPPTAAGGRVVFSGFDDEESPTVGGLYIAPIRERPKLRTLVSIGQRVPGESYRERFNALGEGGAFDGRTLGFWGAWGSDTRTVRLYCPAEGNKDRIDYCNQNLVCADTGEILGDRNSVCDDASDPNYGTRCYQEKEVPVHQGIFVRDTAPSGGLRAVAKTGEGFDELLFWNYSGKVPCLGGGHSDEGGEDEGEPARWRSSAFVAVSGPYTAFKAVARDLVGIYLDGLPGQGVVTVLDTATDGQTLDPQAPIGSTISELGLEREGLRGRWLAVNAKMGIEGGSEEDGMAGIYLTRLPRFR